jgi:Divergent InlB B-repeat domain
VRARGPLAIALAAAATLALPSPAAALSFPLTVTNEGAGQGTVSSSPAGIECGATCQASFEANATVTLTSTVATPETRAAKWTGCDSVTAEDRCVVKMSSARAVTAAFRLGTPLRVVKAGAGQGTVTSSPAGIECGATCEAGFEAGSTVTLTGTALPHSQAVQWSGCDHVISAEHKCEVTMSAARSVTASFELQAQWAEPFLTITKTGNGQGTVTSSPAGIECGATCQAKFLIHSPFTLTATPTPGSVFAGWSGGGCRGAGACTTTLKQETAVKAKFVLVGTRTLTVARAGSGQGTVKGKAAQIECGQTCSAQIGAGKKVSLSAKAAAGSSFAGWSGACSGTVKTCKVTMSEARHVTATFTGPAPAPAAAGTLHVLGVKLKGGRALLKVSCTGSGPCQGTLRLSAKLGGKRSAIGSAPFDLLVGASGRLKVSLTAGAKRALRSAGRLRARVGGRGVGHRWVRLKQ